MANFRLRFSFSEQGRGALLSHLEVQRALTRLLRRAELPFVLTQGFSPRMKLATGPALPVGIASQAEYADVELSRFVKPAEATCRLQSAAPPLLPVLDCAYVRPQEPSLDAWLNAQTIELRIDQALLADRSLEEVCRQFEAVRTGPALEVERKGKLRQYIPADFVPDPLELSARTADSEGERSVIARFMLLLPAAGALRSDVFAAALLSPLGIDLFDITVTRIALFHLNPDGSCQFALPGRAAGVGSQ
ncbi:MAG: TIGR03936 family radical SAM-associated protein [Coriobacteriia bacterium]|nr:TIGR03936 family radical SAM-associated protein [Coriobacteriia bacterium]